MNTNFSDIPLWQRGLGVLAIFAGLLLYHAPTAGLDSQALASAAITPLLEQAQLRSIALSVLFIIGASLATRAWLAIALACAFFSWLQVGRTPDPSSLHTYFLALAILSGAISVFILSLRFRQRILATRQARWESRTK